MRNQNSHRCKNGTYAVDTELQSVRHCRGLLWTTVVLLCQCLS